MFPLLISIIDGRGRCRFFGQRPRLQSIGEKMLIVCTQDRHIRDWAENRDSGSSQWGELVLLPLGPEDAATVIFKQILQKLDPDEPLCLSAHGNDTEIGDENAEGWTWSTADIATLFRKNRDNFNGDLLISACARTVANFSAGLVVAMEDQQTCPGLWVYGYNKPVATDENFPPPVNLAARVDLQGTQVIL